MSVSNGVAGQDAFCPETGFLVASTSVSVGCQLTVFAGSSQEATFPRQDDGIARDEGSRRHI